MKTFGSQLRDSKVSVAKDHGKSSEVGESPLFGTRGIDQSHNTKNWCIILDFTLRTTVIHRKQDGCGSNGRLRQKRRLAYFGTFYHNPLRP